MMFEFLCCVKLICFCNKKVRFLPLLWASSKLRAAPVLEACCFRPSAVFLPFSWSTEVYVMIIHQCRSAMGLCNGSEWH